jgi:hypothetical protein
MSVPLRTPLGIEDAGPRAARGDSANRSLRSPITGAPLSIDTPYSLADGTERWPVIDGIPSLRAGSEALAREAVALLDHGRADEATAFLLAENDPWWDEAPPGQAQLLKVVRDKDRLTLREAMDGLGWGRVGTYFAHRWSDPTFLAGLALLDRHWTAPGSAFEIACGIGHYLRALHRAGVAEVTGGDVVFGKLWVCRHWVCPEARLVCFDAEAEHWPVDSSADLVTCPDALYFLRNKEAVAERIRQGARSMYAVPHVHNAAAENHSAGAAATAEALAALFPEATIYDDAELTRAGASGTEPSALSPRMAEGPDPAKRSEGGGERVHGDGIPLAIRDGRPPVPPKADQKDGSRKARPGGAPGSQPEALSLAWSRDEAAASTLLRPADGTPLVRNPLLTDTGIAWPSPRYEAEYGPIATYGRSGAVPERAVMSDEAASLVRARDLLDLPERW